VRPTPFVLASSLLSLAAVAGCGGGSGGTSPPAPASNLLVTSTTSTAVALAWSDAAGDEQGFAVERSTAGAPFAEIARVGANVMTYQDLGIVADTSYTYRVRSFGAGGEAAPSNEASTTTYTLAALEAMLGQYLGDVRGNEIPSSSVSGDSGGVTYTLTFLGFAFCMPPDPYAPPAATSTPPTTVYGCQNVLSATLTPSGDVITATISVPVLFIDLSTSSSLTGTDDGYVVYTGVQLTVAAALATTPDGRKQIQGPVTATSFTQTSASFYSQDALVASLGSFMLGLVASQVEQQILLAAATAFQGDLALIPPYVP
jgi:hypothetical protein